MDSEILENYIQAGKIAKEAREEAARMAKPGVSLLELGETIEKLIKSKGGDMAFPINLSLNDFAAHYTPKHNDEIVLKDTDVLKIDIGVHIDGYVADTAETVQFGGNEKLVEASREALTAALDMIKPGVKIEDISTKIEEVITSCGYKPVENLTGHALEQYVIHAHPSIPNIKTASPKVLEEDQVVAIEPFASAGAGHVNDTSEILIFSLENARPVRNPDAKKIINFVQRYRGLPFAERWLLSQDAVDYGLPNSLFKIRMALRELVQNNVLATYPPLRDAKGGLVSQSEHTVIVKDEPIVTTR